VIAEVKGQEKGEVIQNSTISTNLELFTDDEQCKAGITRFTDHPCQLTGKGGFLNGILMLRLSLPRTCRSDGHGVAQRRAHPQVGEACPYQPYLGELSIILLLWNVIPVLSS
jgi:hypothetical protein